MRSKFEETIGKALDKLKGVKWWYEPLRIPYKYTTTRYYIPDFVIYKGKLKRPRKPLTLDKLKDTILIEAKGWFKSRDRTKMMFLKEQYPHLDIRFLFQQDNKLTKAKNSMRYSEWAEKNGFQWSVGEEVPKEWINETV